jgi:cell division protein FtsL
MQRAFNESVAYDLSRFDERLQMVGSSGAAAPKKRKRARVINLQSVITFLLVFATLAFILLGYVNLTEMNSQVNTLKQELSSLQDEGRRLSMEVDKRTALKNVEGYATERLGMQQLQSYQVEYVGLNNKDKGVVVAGEEKISLGSVVSKVTNTLNVVLNYIK